MAFVGIMFGSLVGLITAVTGFALFDLSLGHSLVVYATTGVGFALLTILALLLRPPSGPKSKIPAGHPVSYVPSPA